ncbi:Serine/threonine-protein kinase 32B [Penicillium atrosanguineum]|uniref:Serine/threonine-protein kinase 32B n=1 Tax=Penicillium atrosanguineum TaxID=1132637 RepID=A0A9W9PPB5_9EURO|nr:54S ribosomal protein L6 [Penicillium atrosanguineum]KAJ5136460.1 Serine/threonine-protein kinase 32B [Penicillium atrosanguineum]KAJ5292790.1 54S ribosomal protein L6 [Penicillium atrosanguineum]KAJ5303170.1 Serine/threonine-protein kinase 32B [Penicillium atrosanguineum]
MGNSQGKPVAFDEAVNLNHFRLLRVVGKGAFGKVRIVERKDTGLTFALKYIRKEEVVRSESVRNIIRERRMLEHLNHPFLCNLRYSFQDIEYIYIVVDLMNGGDLRFHISRKCFTEDAVRFWMAELGCALKYIHSQGIIHRDLKPDNVLLDSEGHVHLADFNVASDFRPGKPLTSKSGTLAYLAPEVYEGTGYYYEVDWWSLGVTFYECIYNKRPFEGRSQETLSENIKKAQPKYHVTNPAVSVPCLRALGSLIEKDRSRRIGAISWESFTQHMFFADIDFEALERKEYSPVFRPSSDKTNFDATYDLEELLLEEAPLEARARRQKPRAELRDDATAKEIREDELHRLIETMFEPFDYTTVSFQVTAAEAIAAAINPEDCISIATATSTNHARQPSQPESSARNVSTPQHEGSFQRMPPNENMTSASSNLDPNDSAGPQPPSPSSPRITPSPIPPPAPSFHRPLPPNPQRGATRKTSKGGGVQMVLEEAGSWSELANHSSTLPAEGLQGEDGKGKGSNSGMLSFLSRKKGRDRSPKPTEPGVLGKEGSRQIIG